jgi:hypothetical protein
MFNSIHSYTDTFEKNAERIMWRKFDYPATRHPFWARSLALPAGCVKFVSHGFLIPISLIEVVSRIAYLWCKAKLGYSVDPCYFPNRTNIQLLSAVAYKKLKPTLLCLYYAIKEGGKIFISMVKDPELAVQDQLNGINAPEDPSLNPPNRFLRPRY